MNRVGMWAVVAMLPVALATACGRDDALRTGPGNDPGDAEPHADSGFVPDFDVTSMRLEDGASRD